MKANQFAEQFWGFSVQAAQPSSGALGAKTPLGPGGLPPWSDPQSEPCAACHVCRYTFEPPSVFCTSCSQRIKRNQVPGLTLLSLQSGNRGLPQALLSLAARKAA